MKKILFALMMLFVSCGIASAALFESGTKDAQPAVLYGKTDAGVIVPVKVDASGNMAIAPKQMFIDSTDDLGTVIDAIEASGVATQLNLAPGTYTKCGITITTPVKLSIRGSGTANTIISCTSSSADQQVFNISGQDATSYIDFKDLYISVDLTGNYIADGIFVDQTAGTSLTDSQLKFDNVKVYSHSSLGHVYGIRLQDASFDANNLNMNCLEEHTGHDCKCFWARMNSTIDASLSSYMRNSQITAGTGSNSSSFSARAISYYMDNSDHGGKTWNVYQYNTNAYAYQYVNTGGEKLGCYAVNDDTATNGTLNVYYYGGTCGSDYRAIRTSATSNAAINSKYSGTIFYGTSYIPDLIQSSGSATTRTYDAVIPVLGLYNTLANLPTLTGTNAVTGVGTSLIDLVGQTGATNTTASGSVTGGAGGLVSVVSGKGGAATATTGAGTGGAGGAITLTAGDGAAQTNASGTTNTGGAAGKISILGGAGGAANSGSSTDTGGAGSSIYLKPGAGGIGTDTNGADGNVFLAVNSTGTVTGNVMIRSNSVPDGPLVVAPPSSQTISAGNVITDDGCGTIKQITSAGAVTTDTTNTFTAPAVGNKGCCMKVINVGANNITLDNNANFKSAGGADVVMTADDAVTVCSNGSGGKWYQITALEAN